MMFVIFDGILLNVFEFDCVVVIATTNRLDVIERFFRRFGRFDCEFEVGVFMFSD